MRRTRVYIAGPYTRPDPEANTRRAMHHWLALWNQGYAPFCPHWSHFQHAETPIPYAAWMAFDLEWLRVCDAVLRLPGESPGADRECAEARRLGIPVFEGGEPWLEIAEHLPPTREG
jgi:hypothetical protein